MMKNYLVFRLYGSLASWGDIAVGDIRPSYHYPSKSAVIGMIAASMGIKRDHEDHSKHQELSKLSFSVRIDAEGFSVEDYHTIQAPSEQSIKNDRAKEYWTRCDEIDAIEWHGIQGAIQSRRTYLCDAIFTIALNEKETQKIDWNLFGISGLKDVAACMLKPEFVLFLGRKSCPLSLPLEPQMIAAINCKDAFRQSTFTDFAEIDLIVNKTEPRRYYTEEPLENSMMKFTRRDQPVNRITWQFTDRDEYYFHE